MADSLENFWLQLPRVWETVLWSLWGDFAFNLTNLFHRNLLQTKPAPIQCTTCSYECISKIVVRAFLDVVRPQTNLQQSISRWGNVFLSQKSHFFMFFEDFWKYQVITKITISVIKLSFLCFLTFFSKQGLISKQKTRGVCWSMFSEDWSTRDRPVVIFFRKKWPFFQKFFRRLYMIQINRNEDSRCLVTSETNQGNWEP